MILPGVALLLYLYIVDRKKFHVSHNWTLLFLLGLFNVFLTNGLEFWGLQYLHTAKTSLIYSLAPFLSVFLSYLFLREKMDLIKWIGLVIGVLGFIPIFSTNTLKGDEIGCFWIFSAAEIAIACAATATVIGWIIMKKLTVHLGYSSVLANGISFLIGGSLSLLTSLCLETWDPFPVTEWSLFWAGTLYMALVQSIICYQLYCHLLKSFTVTFMSFAGVSSPIFTALYGWLFLDETVGILFFLSLTMVTFGLYLFYNQEKTQ